MKRFVSYATRLYEQEPGEPCDSPLLGLYIERWLRLRFAHLVSANAIPSWLFPWTLYLYKGPGIVSVADYGRGGRRVDIRIESPIGALAVLSLLVA